jgi:mono/diheme cytochrome c family protein
MHVVGFVQLRYRLWAAVAAVIFVAYLGGAAAFAQVPGTPDVTPPAATAPPAPPQPSATPAAPAVSDPTTAPPATPAPVTPPAPPPMPNIKIPARPDEARAAKAYSVFEAHCARCHQSGKTEQPLASGGLANILAVDELARDALVIRPGLPDASPVYDILVTRHAPLDIYAGAGDGAEPRPDDIEAVRDWIREIKPAEQTCADRKPVSTEDRDALIREAQRLERDASKDLRFVSLIHLYNACTPLAELAAYQQALIKLFNALSWAPEPVRLTALDPAGTLFAVKLSDLGWVSGHWDIIQRDYPGASGQALPADIRTSAGAAVPLINGDWFAAAASEPPLYYALLGLPAKLTELAKMNGVDIDQNIKSAAARRIAIRSSVVTRGNRLAERHAGGRGPMWLMYDFATSAGDQDLFERPLGPKPSPRVRDPFKPDEIRVAFALPNGFYAYAVFDAAGNRVDRVLPGLEKAYAGTESNALEPVTKPGSNCFACHAVPVRVYHDDFRGNAATQASTPSTLPKDVTDIALTIYSNDSETALLASGDNDHYRSALQAAKIDPDLTVKGQEIVTALALHYRGGSDVKAAVAEAGLEREAFMKTLSETEGPAAALARRLQQGVLPRQELDRLFALLKGIDKPVAAQASGGFLRDVKSEIGLSVWIDKLVPAKGDLVVIKAQADTDCYLTVVSVDAEGKATVLFPNDFDKDNLLSAGKTVSVPGGDSPYQLRFKADGTETLISRCSTSSVAPTGIEHDFERQRFTLLGNWENFIQDTLVTEAELRRIPEKAERARAAKAQDLRRRRERGENTDARPDTSPGAALRDGRSVVVIGRN